MRLEWAWPTSGNGPIVSEAAADSMETNGHRRVSIKLYKDRWTAGLGLWALVGDSALKSSNTKSGWEKVNSLHDPRTERTSSTSQRGAKEKRACVRPHDIFHLLKERVLLVKNPVTSPHG